MKDQLFSLREVSQLTDTPLNTVRRWVAEQRLPVERIGPAQTLKRIRVRQSVLLQLFPDLRIYIKVRQSD